MVAQKLRKIAPHIAKAIEESLLVQFNVKAHVDSVTVSGHPEAKSVNCLSFVAMEASLLRGVLTIGFSRETLLVLRERMTGETGVEVCAECGDASAELLNIVYASARKSINEEGFDFKPAIPSSLIGTISSSVKAESDDQSVTFECSSDTGPFIVQLFLNSKK